MQRTAFVLVAVSLVMVAAWFSANYQPPLTFPTPLGTFEETPSGAAFYSDTFTGEDGSVLSAHTSDSGHTYEAHSSYGNTVQIQGNRVHATAGAAYRRPILTPPSADYEVTGLLYVHTDDDSFVSIGGRAGDSGQYVTLFNVSGEIQVWGSGVLITGTAISPQAGSSHRIKTAFKGTLIRAFHNRREIGFVTNSEISAAGRPTFGFNDTSGTLAGIHLDSAYADATFSESQIVFVGDSITAGYGLTLAETYPSKVMSSLGDGETDWANRAVSGQTLATMIANEAQITACSRPDAARNIVVDLSGSNDLADGDSAQDVVDRITSYAATIRGAGQSYIRLTIPYADESNESIPDDFNEKRATVNAWIAAHDELFDGTADASTAIGSDPANFSDHIHLTDAGTTVLAGVVTSAIQTMENTQPASDSTAR